jgi:hypothetical protein
MCYQILMKMKKPKSRPSVWKPSMPLPASSGALKSGSRPVVETPNSLVKTGALANEEGPMDPLMDGDVQRLLAGLAVKVLQETKAQRR